MEGMDEAKACMFRFIRQVATPGRSLTSPTASCLICNFSMQFLFIVDNKLSYAINNDNMVGSSSIAFHKVNPQDDLKP